MAPAITPADRDTHFRLRRRTPDAEIRREIGRVLGAIGNTRAARRVRPPSEAEVARAVAEFHARGGQVTVCPTAHAVPVFNGAGRDAQHWTA
jgi:hypothetical protein